MIRPILPCLLLLAPALTLAGKADVVDARVEKAQDGSYRFQVSVSHLDQGWDHYADRWELLGPDGQELARRTLYHPHVQEQPFTRSLAGVRIPAGIRRVTLRAHDSRHGYGGKTLTLSRPCQGRLRAKKRRTTASSWVLVMGGRLRMKTLP